MKSPFHDIIPPNKRSIRNVSLNEIKKIEHAHHSKHEHKTHTQASSIKEETREDSSVTHHKINKQLQAEIREVQKEIEDEKDYLQFQNDLNKVGGMSKLVLWLIAGVALLALFFGVTWIFTNATIRVTQKKESIDMPSSMTFELKPTTPDDLAYSSIELSDSADSLIDATGEKIVSQKAGGTILIYNNFNTSSQKLITGTRFETPKGLIFKLDSAVTVPGQSKSAGKIIPGSVEAHVTAEKPGEDYNVGLTDFTIPGFKGDAKFDKFYARSKTAVTGGNTGTVATVDDATLQAAITDLQNKLSLSLKEKAGKELPNTQVSFNGMESITFATSSPKSENKKAHIEVKGTVKLFSLNTTALAKKLLASKNLQTREGDEFSIDTKNTKSILQGEDNGKLSIAFTGSSTIIYRFNEEQFKKDIAGKTKSEAEKISSLYAGEITSFSIILKPFWRLSIPSDPSKINIELN